MSAIETLPAPELCFAAPVDDKWERERRAFVRMLPDPLVTPATNSWPFTRAKSLPVALTRSPSPCRPIVNTAKSPSTWGLSDQPPVLARIPSPRTPNY